MHYLIKYNQLYKFYVVTNEMVVIQGGLFKVYARILLNGLKENTMADRLSYETSNARMSVRQFTVVVTFPVHRNDVYHKTENLRR